MAERINRAFEKNLFLYLLVAAIGFRILRILQELFIDTPIALRLSGLFNLILFLIGIWCYKKWFRASLLVFYLSIAANTFLSWDHAGGWQGPYTYAFLLVIVSLPLVADGWVLYLLLLANALVLALLSSGLSPVFPQTTQIDTSSLFLEFNYVVSIIILIALTIFTKRRFYAYRDRVARSNERLISVQRIIETRNQELETQYEELHLIRAHLKTLATERQDEVNLKAELLRGYAFANAHSVRGPVARILGLIQLIEREPRDPLAQAQIGDIKNSTTQLDSILKKISKLTG